MTKILADDPKGAASGVPGSPSHSLDELHPEELFRELYRRGCSPESILNEPSERLMEAFRLLWNEQEKGEGR